MKKMGERRGTKALETWCRRLTEGYPGVKIENMTTSWRDGLAFCAIIHHFRPDLIDFSSLNKDDIYYNCSLAFSVAERSLGIPALLDAEDMVEFPVPDRLSILTYLSQFYQVFGGSTGSPTRIVAKRPAVSTDSCLSPPSTSPPTKMAAKPSNMPVQGLGRREPCVKCSMPVFLAERLHVGTKLYHRTCFRCARCNHQLSLANCYETETDGVFCCETCPDEEDQSPTPQVDLTDHTRSLSDEQKQKGLQHFDDDPYSLTFESSLNDSQLMISRREIISSMLHDDDSDIGTPLSKPRSISKSMETDSEPDISKIDTDISKFDSNASIFDSDTSKLDLEASKLDPDGSKFDSDASKFDPDGSKFDSDVSKFDSDASKLDSDASKLDSYVSKMDFDVSKLDSNVSKLDSDVSKLNTDVPKLDSDVSKSDLECRTGSVVELRKKFGRASPSSDETKPPDRAGLTISVNSVKKSDSSVNRLDQQDTASDVFNTNVTKDSPRQSLVQNRKMLFETQAPNRKPTEAPKTDRQHPSPTFEPKTSKSRESSPKTSPKYSPNLAKYFGIAQQSEKTSPPEQNKKDHCTGTKRKTDFDPTEKDDPKNQKTTPLEKNLRRIISQENIPRKQPEVKEPEKNDNGECKIKHSEEDHNSSGTPKPSQGSQVLIAEHTDSFKPSMGHGDFLKSSKHLFTVPKRTEGTSDDSKRDESLNKASIIKTPTKLEASVVNERLNEISTGNEQLKTVGGELLNEVSPVKTVLNEIIVENEELNTSFVENEELNKTTGQEGLNKDSTGQGEIKISKSKEDEVLFETSKGHGDLNETFKGHGDSEETSEGHKGLNKVETPEEHEDLVETSKGHDLSTTSKTNELTPTGDDPLSKPSRTDEGIVKASPRGEVPNTVSLTDKSEVKDSPKLNSPLATEIKDAVVSPREKPVPKARTSENQDRKEGSLRVTASLTNLGNPFGDEDEDESVVTGSVEALCPIPPKRTVLPRKSSFILESTVEYPSDLNPFGDEEEEVKKVITPSVEDRIGPKGEEGGRKVVEAPRISLNPFWSDGEEPSEDEDGGKPIPLPRNNLKSLGTPEPKPRRSGEKYDSNSSLSSHTSSLGRRKKKPAPKPPVQSPTTPNTLSPNKSLTLSNTSSPRTYRKNRRAPLPPSSTPKSADPKPDVSNDLELEKIDKDERNRNRQSQSMTSSVSESESLTSPVIPDKSTFGKWKRRKGPAPSRPVPQRRQIKPLPLQQLKHELELIELQQQGLEKQGVKLEQLIREKCEGPEMSEDSSLTPEVEELVIELFELVNEKNELFRRQAELMYLRRQQRLEEEYADLEYQIRCLMNQPERNKTDSDKAREEELISRLVQVVERRNEIVECLEMDRVREAEEDHSINTRLNLIQSKREEEYLNNSLSESPVKLSKKEKKKMKKEKKLKEKGKNADVDKDIDETEVAGKDRKKRKWF